MAKLITDVVENYLDILSNTIPQMISGASVPARAGLYCALALLYPLALIVLLALTAVASIAVFTFRALVESKKTSSP